MSIYTIADLHLSFKQNKPMNIFGQNWENHEQKIKQNWINTVNENDYVILPGDFSWATYLEDAYLDFEYLNNLPGNKILLKGNHDYWWTTITNMKKFLKLSNMKKIDFLYNNSFFIEGKLIVGTRGWNILDSDNSMKMINRESIRLELSIKDAINTYGTSKEIIVFMHYPPITLSTIQNNIYTQFVDIMKKYNIKRCYYGHLHGQSHIDAVEGINYGIEFRLVSADYLNFRLLKIN